VKRSVERKEEDKTKKTKVITNKSKHYKPERVKFVEG
jgi:hypothetical protein